MAARLKKGAAKADALRTKLAQLDEACREPSSPEANAALRDALASPTSHVIARAAELVGRHRIGGLGVELCGAYARMFEDPIKADPGCNAKKAILDALDLLEHDDYEPFLTGVRHRQDEPVWGGSADTATAVRSRALMALVRLEHPDALLFIGELLGDPEAPVRRAATDALVYHGDRACAALAMQKLAAGDDDPLTLAGAALALVELAPEWGIPVVRGILFGRDSQRRELAALALGQSKRPAALDLLFEWLDQSILPEPRQRAIAAIGLHRDPRARERLLRLVAEGDRISAGAAILALSIHKYDPSVVKAVGEAAARNPAVDLRALVARAFASE